MELKITPPSIPLLFAGAATWRNPIAIVSGPASWSCGGAVACAWLVWLAMFRPGMVPVDDHREPAPCVSISPETRSQAGPAPSLSGEKNSRFVASGCVQSIGVR